MYVVRPKATLLKHMLPALLATVARHFYNTLRAYVNDPLLLADPHSTSRRT